MKRALLLPVIICWTVPGLTLENVERFQLGNGLTVVVRENHRLPLVNVTCMYRVGGANEAAGITGIAHYVEHMAFRATENVSKSDITGTIERMGGRWNGYTWIDQTLYGATVPSWALDSVLHIEAERMSRVLFDPVEFERERTSVIAELQGYENDPASILGDLTVASSFEIHPYRFNVIGWLTDVLAIRRDEAFGFYKDLYGPNNAVLAVVGDVEASEVRRRVETHFGSLPPSARSAEVRAIEPPQRGEKRIELRHPGSQKTLAVAYRSLRAVDPEFPVLVVLDALLTGGRGLRFGSRAALPSSPLREAIEEAGGATLTTSWTPTRAPYVYTINVSAPPDADLSRIEEAIERTIRHLEVEGPTRSALDEARRRIRAAAAYEADSLADAAHRLAFFEALDSWRLAETILAAAEKVTAEDIRGYVDKHLRREQRTVGRHVPAEVAVREVRAPAVVLPDPVPSPSSPVPEKALEPLPAAQILTARALLPNGASVRVATREGTSGTLRVRIAFGSALDPPGKEGLALLAARLVLADAQMMSSLAPLGAQVVSSAGGSPTAYENREFFDLEIRFLPGDLGVVADAVARALGRRDWKASEIERLRSQLQNEISALSSDATWVATRSALELVDPRWRPPCGTDQSVRAIAPEEVRTFVASHLAGNAVTAGLACPGPTSALLHALTSAFGRLPAGRPPVPILESGNLQSAEVTTRQVPMEGKTRTEVAAALPGIERGHPDDLPFRLLNYVLGETGYAGRLGKKLVDAGISYSVYAVPHGGRVPGPLLISTGTSPANLGEALQRIQDVVRDLGTAGLEASEWREARAYRIGRLVLDLDSPDDLALALVDAEYFGEDRLDLASRSKEILAVTHERLTQVAKRYLRPELLRIGTAGAIPRPSQP